MLQFCELAPPFEGTSNAGGNSTAASMSACQDDFFDLTIFYHVTDY